MKTFFIFLSISGLCTAGIDAQDLEIDLEARKRSLVIIESRIEEREAEIDEISSDILAIHARIDEKLGRMVERMVEIEDSAKSGLQVSKAKLELIDTLQEMVLIFQARREGLVRSLVEGRSDLPPEEAKDEIRHFDEHVEHHIGQMLELSMSFSQDENVEKYKRLGGGGYYGDGSGWYGDVLEISEEWRQNRKNRSMNRKQREEVIGALRESVARCESRIRNIREFLKRDSLTEASRDIAQSELRTHQLMLQKRRGEIEDRLIVKKPDTTEVSKDAADDLEEALADLLDDVQRNIQMITLKHTQLNREQENLGKLKENLKARKEWLDAYEKKAAE
ncbi:MAG: hypothetical protein CMO55_17655 [Verrucomicrobiales bacterium]|nr:hypothetical protein [Verrucomicrobiales bacterium]